MSHNHYLVQKYKNKVNFGLDEFNTHPDLSFINGIAIFGELVVLKDAQYFIDNNIKFIYPIPSLDSNLFYTKPPKLNIKIRNACNSGLCKVGIFFDSEGTEYGDPHFKWFKSFAMLNALNFTNFFFSHGNRILADSYKKYLKGEEPAITILKYSFFHDFPWFLYNKKAPTKIHIIEHCIKTLEHNRKIQKEKHFLCLNRVSRVSRLLMFAVIASNPKLESKSILTVGNLANSPEPSNPHKFISLNINLKGEKLTGQESNNIPARLQNFLNSYDWNKRKHVLDNFDDKNKALSINLDFHKSTFVNIVTETLQSKETLFFSEKIFKPIYMLQPFILLCSPYSLRELKKLGYKTFDRWWDESYDEEENLISRVLKIEKILKKLSNLTPDELFALTADMEETLIHNYSVLFFEPKQESLDYFNFLTFNTPLESSPVKKVIRPPIKKIKKNSLRII